VRFFFANTDTDFTLQSGLGEHGPQDFQWHSQNNYRNFSLTHTYIFNSHLLNQTTVRISSDVRYLRAVQSVSLFRYWRYRVSSTTTSP